MRGSTVEEGQGANPPSAIRPSSLLVPLLALMLSGCNASTVAEAEGRWQERGVSDYRIRVEEFHSIWCYYDTTVEVRAGAVVSATVIAYPGPAQQCWAYTEGLLREPVHVTPGEAVQWTVPGLFEEAHHLEKFVGKKDMRITLEFDEELGYPSRLFHDNEVALDDDGGFRVTQFEPLEP